MSEEFHTPEHFRRIAEETGHDPNEMWLGVLRGIERTVEGFIEAFEADDVSDEVRHQVMHMSVTANNSLHRLQCEMGSRPVTVVSGEQAYELFRRMGMTPETLREKMELSDGGELPQQLQDELERYFEQFEK